MNLEEKDTDFVLVDLDKIIRSRKSKLLKILPQFVINYIKRFIHQDDINHVLTTCKGKHGIEFINASLDLFNFKTTLIGGEYLPADKRYMFVANHTLGGFDGVVLIKYLTERYGKTMTIINDLLMNLKPLRDLFVPVSIFGNYDKERIKLLNKAFSEDYNLLMFPAGLVSRKIKGEIMDLQWKKTFLTKAIEYKRDIIPIYTDGKLSNRFYRWAAFRKFLKMKTNIEMFLLPDETFKQKNGNLTIYIGKPIPYTTFTDSHTIEEWVQLVKDHVYKLRDDVNQNFKY